MPKSSSGSVRLDATVLAQRGPAPVLASDEGPRPAVVLASDEDARPAPNATASMRTRKPLRSGKGAVLGGRYELLEKIGAGGMGDVYLARHIDLDRMVAIKILGLEFTRKQELVKRFNREARAASMIRHDNIVDITDFGRTDDDVPYFVMEWLEGEDLAATLQREGPMHWERARRIVLQILAALEAAHAHGVIHRDIKPSNCFRLHLRGNPDYVKVLDFGIAKIKSNEGEEDSGAPKTGTGVVMGTTDYMSPEQAQGFRLDPRTDLYSVGVILFELITGQLPFTGTGPLGSLIKRVSEPPPSPRELAPDADISAPLERLVLKSLAPDVDQRFQSARDFAYALEHVGSFPTPTAPERPLERRSTALWLALTGLLAAGCVAALAWIAMGRPSMRSDRGPERVAANQVAEHAATPTASEGPERPADGDPSEASEPPSTAALTAASEMRVGATSGAAPADAGSGEQPASASATGTADDEAQPAEVPDLPDAAETGDVKDKPVDTTGDKPVDSGDKPVDTTGDKPGDTGSDKPPPASTLPDRPSARAVRSRLRKAERQARKRCEKRGAIAGMQVRVNLTIDPAGKVTAAKAQAPYDTMPLGRCLVEVARGLKFPASRLGMSSEHRFTF